MVEAEEEYVLTQFADYSTTRDFVDVLDENDEFAAF